MALFFNVTDKSGTARQIGIQDYTAEIPNVVGVYFTLPQVENYVPAFDPTITYLVDCLDHDYVRIKKSGIRDLLNLRELCLTEERFTFKNGNYIRFYKTVQGDYYEYCMADGTVKQTIGPYATATDQVNLNTFWYSYNKINGKYYDAQALQFRHLDPSTMATIDKYLCNRTKTPIASIPNPRIDQWWNGIAPDEEDPYGPGGYSGPGGGLGTFDGTSDVIPIPPLPALSAVDTGFCTLYNPSIDQLKRVASVVWGNNFFDKLNNIISKLDDAIIGLNIVPVAVPDGETVDIVVGGINTDIECTKAASQYVEIDCGTLNVQEFWGNYLDYSPNTRAFIYLPYIGHEPIQVDDIMNKDVHVAYHIDLLSGACVAFVQCGGSVLYQYNGQCAQNIPTSGANYSTMISAIIGIGATAATAGAFTAGAAAAKGIEGLALKAAAAGQAGQIASNVMNLKPQITHSDAMSGAGGQLGVQQPYLILERPRQSLPATQKKTYGYPANMSLHLGSCSGFTVIAEIHLEGFSWATADELQELDEILKKGVFF